MVDNKRLLEIDNRLMQIQAIKSSAEESSPVSKDKRLSQIDERLSQINKLKQKEENIPLDYSYARPAKAEDDKPINARVKKIFFIFFVRLYLIPLNKNNIIL